MKTIETFKKREVSNGQLLSINGGAIPNVQVITSRRGNAIIAVFFDDANGNGKLDGNEAVLDIQRYELHAQ